MNKLPDTFITIVTCPKPLDRVTREQMARDVAHWREDISKPLVLDENAQLHIHNLITGQTYSTEQAANIFTQEERDVTLTSLPDYPTLLREKTSDGNLLNPPLNL